MSANQQQDADISADAVRACLEKLLACRAFVASPKIQRLLAFIVAAKLAGESSRLKAYTLGVEVFGRPTGFDPEKDSIVRVNAGRLRAMLEAYYQHEGREDAIRIVLRKGSYVPIFSQPPATVDAPIHHAGRVLLAVERLRRIGGSAEQDYVAAGLTDELVSTLCGYGDSLTVVRTPSEDGQRVLPETSQYSLAYFLRGSVRQHGDELRICIKLVEAATGCVAWSETFANRLSTASLFDIEVRVARKVASTVLDPHGVLYRTLKRKPAALLGTYLAVFRYHEYEEHFSPKRHLVAREELERAVGQEPDYAEAWAVLANVYLGEALFGFNPTLPLPALIEQCVETAQRAVALEPRNVMANYILAMMLFYRQDLPQFLATAEHALRLGPYHPDNLAVIGMHLSLAGQWERGRTLVAQAMALNPFHPSWYYLAFSLHHLHFGQYEDALAALSRCAGIEFFPFQINLAVIHGHLGNLAEARLCLQRMFTLWPQARHRMDEILDFWFPFENLAVVFAEGLAKAGFPLGGYLKRDSIRHETGMVQDQAACMIGAVGSAPFHHGPPASVSAKNGVIPCLNGGG